MEIRKDLVSASIYLERLSLLGDTFHIYNTEDWSHLKNKEDFRKIYALDKDSIDKFEAIYQNGRDIAVNMSYKLKAFNSPDEYPTLTSYIQSFQKGWLPQIKDLEEISCQATKKKTELGGCPWAVTQMIDLFNNQIKLLYAIEATLTMLKTTDIYKVENGEITMSQNQTDLYFNNVSGRIYFNSIDNSTNLQLANLEDLFSKILGTVEASDIDPSDKTAILSAASELKTAVNTPSFSTKYKEFIQVAANYMTIISPFIPELSKLING